ncbi:hypothetical protein CGRA01v4_02372 [Colletotrichum graminicola]|nr:hypothetical protein CGRA01v4_02372 [Colletotrichum graminicola]
MVMAGCQTKKLPPPCRPRPQTAPQSRRRLSYSDYDHRARCMDRGNGGTKRRRRRRELWFRCWKRRLATCVYVYVCVYVCVCVYGADRGSDSEPALNPQGRTSGGHVIQHTVRVGPRREGERDERRRGCYLMGEAKGGSDRLTDAAEWAESPGRWDGMGWDGKGWATGGERVAAVWACLTLSFSAYTAHRCTDSVAVGSTRVRRR